MRIVSCVIFSLLVFTGLVGCGVDWFPSPTSSVSITTTTLPAAIVNTAYTQTLSAYGGTAPYTWSVASGTLPAGLTLSTSGVISGTPTTAGTSTFVVQVTDSSTPALTATRAFSIQVTTGNTPIIVPAGQTIILNSGQSAKVPAGTTVTVNGVVTIIVTGDNQTYSTVGGAVVSVPSSAAGLVADNTITAQ